MSISAQSRAVLTADKSEVIVDRRSDERHRATYRPCCVIAAKKVTMGLIRNFSAGGARIEIDADLELGDKVSYFWETDSCIWARVVWRSGKAYGLEHLDHKPTSKTSFPLRSVRVPCQAEANCWVGGELHVAKVENISIGGMRVSGLPPLRPGALLTIRFCDLDLEAVSVRWSHNRRHGLKFSERMTREMLAQLLLDDRFGLASVEFASDQSDEAQLEFEGLQ